VADPKKTTAPIAASAAEAPVVTPEVTPQVAKVEPPKSPTPVHPEKAKVVMSDKPFDEPAAIVEVPPFLSPATRAEMAAGRKSIAR